MAADALAPYVARTSAAMILTTRYIEYTGPSLTWGRILSTCVKSMWRNDIKCKYMFMFPLKNLARKGLKLLPHLPVVDELHQSICLPTIASSRAWCWLPILSNSSIQQHPWSASTSAPASRAKSPPPPLSRDSVTCGGNKNKDNQFSLNWNTFPLSLYFTLN